MSNIDRTAVLAWVATVNGMAVEMGRPIENTSDPRYVALFELLGPEGVALLPLDDTTRDEWGLEYLCRIGKDLLPPAPIEQPEWAESCNLDLDDYPRTVTVEFEGKLSTAGEGAGVDGSEAGAFLFESFAVVTQEHEGHAVGDVLCDGLVVEMMCLEPKFADRAGSPVNLTITVGSARALRMALADVLEGVPSED